MGATIAPRAEHVGSLLRPAELQKAWGAVFAGQMDRADMAEIEDRAITAALAGQAASVRDGIHSAAAAIDSGRALATLDTMARSSHAQVMA